MLDLGSARRGVPADGSLLMPMEKVLFSCGAGRPLLSKGASRAQGTL